MSSLLLDYVTNHVFGTVEELHSYFLIKTVTMLLSDSLQHYLLMRYTTKCFSTSLSKNPLAGLWAY